MFLTFGDRVQKTLLLFSLMMLVITSASASSIKPNIVFILIDDMGWQDVGFMGSEYYETPNIDRFAKQSMVFNNAYANAPNCAPTRAAFMTGLYPHKTGIHTVENPDRGSSSARRLEPIKNKMVLEPEYITLAEVLKKSGYVSASIGKWHLGEDAQRDPNGQGFDYNVAGNRWGRPYGGYFSPYMNPQLKDGKDGEYLTDRLTDEAIGFIDKHQDQPFFLYMSHYAVHTPVQGKPEKIAKYKKKAGSRGQNNATYGALVESTDESVGRILKALEDKGLSDNTIVVFTSDNGGHGKFTKMPDLRGSKGNLYEGGVRVPLAIRWPGHIERGTRSSEMVATMDFFPTLLSMTRSKKPSQVRLDGEDLSGVLTEGEKLQRDSLFWHFPSYLEPYADFQGVWRTTPAGSIRKGSYKLIEYFEFGQLELYDLDTDLAEKNNLALALPEKTAELRAEMLAWRKTSAAPIPTTLNPDYNPDYQPRNYTTWADVRAQLRNKSVVLTGRK